jgi:hypothetical protein
MIGARTTTQSHASTWAYRGHSCYDNLEELWGGTAERLGEAVAAAPGPEAALGVVQAHLRQTFQSAGHSLFRPTQRPVAAEARTAWPGCRSTWDMRIRLISAGSAFA